MCYGDCWEIVRIGLLVSLVVRRSWCRSLGSWAVLRAGRVDVLPFDFLDSRGLSTTMPTWQVKPMRSMRSDPTNVTLVVLAVWE